MLGVAAFSGCGSALKMGAAVTSGAAGGAGAGLDSLTSLEGVSLLSLSVAGAATITMGLVSEFVSVELGAEDSGVSVSARLSLATEALSVTASSEGAVSSAGGEFESTPFRVMVVLSDAGSMVSGLDGASIRRNSDSSSLSVTGSVRDTV